MKNFNVSRFAFAVCMSGAILAGCGSSRGVTPSLPSTASLHERNSSTSSTPITHIVLMIQENRSFNNLFAGFPGATSSKTGEELVLQGSQYVEQKIKLTAAPLLDKQNVTHLYKPAFLTAYQNGDMDGFDLIPFINGKLEGKLPYQYVEPSKIKPYWAIAKQWGLANDMFQTQGSDSFTAHQDLIRGGTFIDSSDSLIDPPTSPLAWGCDAAKGSATTLITTGLQYEKNHGPFPCSNRFPDYGSDGYKTLRDLLDAKSVSWKYYTPKFEKKEPNGLWNAFDLIAPVRYGKEWTDGHIASPPSSILKAISDGKLPSLSWVIPDAQNSDHPAYSTKDTGPSWVASIVNAVGESDYWDSTAVIVVWDDWGGFYDPVAPPLPRDNQGGPGFRVPMLVISPYVKTGTGSQGGYISNTVYGFGSIIRFIEDTWNLGRLGTTDGTSTSMADMFNFNQAPRSYTPIKAEYTKEYFLHQKPSGLPVDTE
jgi:phospholipase C